MTATHQKFGIQKCNFVRIKNELLTISDRHGRNGDGAALDLHVATVPEYRRGGLGHAHGALELQRLVLLDLDLRVALVTRDLHRLGRCCNHKNNETLINFCQIFGFSYILIESLFSLVAILCMYFLTLWIIQGKVSWYYKSLIVRVIAFLCIRGYVTISNQLFKQRCVPFAYYPGYMYS